MPTGADQALHVHLLLKSIPRIDFLTLDIHDHLQHGFGYAAKEVTLIVLARSSDRSMLVLVIPQVAYVAPSGATVPLRPDMVSG